MNAQQRRVIVRALPKQGSLIEFNRPSGTVAVRVAGPVLNSRGRINVNRLKVVNPATRGRSTPLLKQLSY
jgi:RNase P/RNase MRP subunit p29